jgi:hypothetical protein
VSSEGGGRGRGRRDRDWRGFEGGRTGGNSLERSGGRNRALSAVRGGRSRRGLASVQRNDMISALNNRGIHNQNGTQSWRSVRC